MDFLKEVEKFKKENLNEELSKARELMNKYKPCQDSSNRIELLYESLKRHRKEKRPFVIAEIKRASPSRGVINADIDAKEQALLYEHSGASALSVLTEENWFKGSLKDLSAATEASSIPVLMKDFIVDVSQIEVAAGLGASMVLFISVLLRDKLSNFIKTARELGVEPFIETRSIDEIEEALKLGAKVVGINSRNLSDLSVEKEIFERVAPFVSKMRENVYFIAESGIRTEKEVIALFELGYDGVLIGERLSKSKKPKLFFQNLKMKTIKGRSVYNVS